ncbi:hypothetical protein THRCLA_23246 [Thraustotheca clavata]|uniref:Uncharacterized protein n=1 Tax=Thraustotheca clavata TaxID=74557 RepID=A0A1V9Y8N8_9STRA|nr:hypothetical protein THRCLA_23246 [Thraustotheca clavata]
MKAKTCEANTLLVANAQSGSFRKNVAWSEKQDVVVTFKPRVRVDPNPRHSSKSPSKDSSLSPPKIVNKLSKTQAHTSAFVVDSANAVADIERVSGVKWDSSTGFIRSPLEHKEKAEKWVQPRKRPSGVGARNQRSMNQGKHSSRQDPLLPQVRWL